MVTGEAASYRQLSLPAHSHHRQRLAARHHPEPQPKDAWTGRKWPVPKTRPHQQQVDDALQQVLLRCLLSRFASRNDAST